MVSTLCYYYYPFTCCPIEKFGSRLFINTKQWDIKLTLHGVDSLDLNIIARCLTIRIIIQQSA